MDKTDLGDRMKMYEKAEAKRLMSYLPAMARLDGKNFSKFTKGLNRPYDQRLTEVMVELTRYLVEATGAKLGYTQSDEITLTWYQDHQKSQLYFDGRVFKMISHLSALVSVYFNKLIYEQFPEKKHYWDNNNFPTFDCRVWNVPTCREGANTFLWRELDATKNSVSMAARCMFSHKQLMDKNGKEMIEMMHFQGIQWSDFPSAFKRGTYVKRQKVTRKFTTDEIDLLPLKHEARRNPELEIERTEIGPLDMPPFLKLVNPVGMIYNNEMPQTHNKV